MEQKASPIFEKIRSNHRLSEQIANRMKKAIFNKSLVPGDKLPPEKELASIFGTSRTTTREAIRLLETSGLLIVKQGQDGGAFIIQPDLSRVQSLITDLIKTKQLRIEHFTDARMMLEPNIVESALKIITSEEMELLEQNVKDAEEELSREKPRNVSINIKFHKILIESAGNPIITIVMGLLFDILKTYLREVNPDKLLGKQVVASHRKILETIKEGNAEGVRKLMEAHIENVNSILKDI